MSPCVAVVGAAPSRHLTEIKGLLDSVSVWTSPIPIKFVGEGRIAVDGELSERNERRVAFFLPSLAGGGGERVMLEIARHFVQHGFVVDVVITRRGGPLWESVPEHVRLINFQSWKTPTCLPKLIRYIRRERPAVLISAVELGNLTALLAKRFFTRRLRLIVSQHTHFTAMYQHCGFMLRVALRLTALLLPAADTIVAVSSGVAEDLYRWLPRMTAGRVRIIPNPVVTPALVEQARLPVEHSWFDDPRTPVVLTVGRLVIRYKDQPTLLKAFAEILKSRSAKLIVLGEGPDKAGLMDLAHQLGIQRSVDFVGFQPNPFAYMARAQIFVLSSLFEGLPTALIEAMACGVPVVATDCPGGLREILEGGKWGRLVPVGDWRLLARGILDTLDNPVPADYLTARANHYSSTASGDRYVELANRLMQASLEGG